MPTLDEAIAEAYASAPDTGIVLDCMEIDHPVFTRPARVVNWPVTGPEPERFHLLHEPDAPIDPNQTVEYIGLPFEGILPDQTESSLGMFKIRFSPNDDFDQYLEQAAMSNGIIKATYRQYLQGREMEGPAACWYDLTITSPRREGGMIIADATVLVWAGNPYGDLYTPSGYPAMVPGR